MPGASVTRRTVASLAVVTVAAGVLAACGGHGGDPVTTAPVGRSTVNEVVEAPATVVARRTATVTAPATGTVAHLYVRSGATVAKGQRLLRIDSPSARQALADAEQADAQAAGSTPAAAPTADISASVKQSDAAAKRAFAQAQRAIDALPAGAARTAAQAQLVAAKAQYAAARTAVTQAVAQLNAGVGSASAAVSALGRAQRVQTQAAVTAATRVVAALTVRAPSPGVVSFDGSTTSGSSSTSSGLSSLLGQLSSSGQASGAASSLLGGSGGSSSTGEVTAGSPVSAGQVVATVTDVSALTLSAQVDETDVLQVHRGVPADVELAAVPDAVYAARVVSVGLAPVTSSRGGVTYTVRLHLGAGRRASGGAAPAPLPGMSAVARLRVVTARGVTSVPASAVFQDGRQSAVWLVTNGTAHRTVVRLGAQGEASYQILDGVSVGDVVVVHGADSVHEGQRVG